MTDLERVELAVRRVAARYSRSTPGWLLLHQLSDELLRTIMEKDPVEDAEEPRGPYGPPRGAYAPGVQQS